MLPVNINCQSLISTGRPGVSRTRDQQLEENMLGLRTSDYLEYKLLGACSSQIGLAGIFL